MSTSTTRRQTSARTGSVAVAAVLVLLLAPAAPAMARVIDDRPTSGHPATGLVLVNGVHTASGAAAKLARLSGPAA